MSEPTPEYHLDEVVIENVVPLPDAVTEERIASLVDFALRAEEALGGWTVGLRFVSDAEMQQMHLDFMGLDSPTDIMTFPHESEDWISADDVAAEEWGGDIVISVDRAADQAVEGDWDLTHELFFLVCHGMLHLLDWDDHDDADRARMLARQREILQEWLAANPL